VRPPPVTASGRDGKGCAVPILRSAGSALAGDLNPRRSHDHAGHEHLLLGPRRQTTRSSGSINDKLRDERLNERWFDGLADVRFSIESWRVNYNPNRSHRSLENPTLCALAARPSECLRSAPPRSGLLALEIPAAH